MDGSEEHQKYKVMGLEFRTLGMGLDFVLDLGLRLGLGATKWFTALQVEIMR